jgi:sugar/nucleoside kinase (ribokinase family)
MLVNILKQNDVNAEGCLFDQHARTALAFVTLKKNGEREFMFYRNPSADMLLTEAKLNLDLIRRGKIFHYGSISLISEPCRGAYLATMRAAKGAGILCSYDPNVRRGRVRRGPGSAAGHGGSGATIGRAARFGGGGGHGEPDARDRGRRGREVEDGDILAQIFLETH